MHGASENEQTASTFYDSCASTKSKRAPRRAIIAKDAKEVRPSERVFSAVVGSMRYESIGKPKYFVAILELCSRHSLVRSIHSKSKAGDAVIELVIELGNLFSWQTNELTTVNRNCIKWLKTDGGGEYNGGEFQNWLKKREIVHEMTSAYSPESIGSAERLNKPLFDVARTTLLCFKNRLSKFQAEALTTA